MARVGATLLIWVMFTIIIISLMTSVTGPIVNASGSEAFGIVVAIALAAAISTAAIWSGGRSDEDESMARAIGKAKRRNPRRVAALLDTLDDDEIYDLEALLLARERESQRDRS